MHEDTVSVTVRRAPRVGGFILMGVVVGLIAAIVLTYAFGGTGAETTQTGFTYTKSQILGFLALWLIPICAGLFGLWAYYLDKRATSNAKVLEAEHDIVTPVDDAGR